MSIDKEQLKLAIKLNIEAAGKCASLGCGKAGSGQDAFGHAKAARVLLSLHRLSTEVGAVTRLAHAASGSVLMDADGDRWLRYVGGAVYVNTINGRMCTYEECEFADLDESCGPFREVLS